MATATTKKRRKVSKAQKVRDAIAELGGKDARPRDVIAHLAERKVRVSSAQVSTIKSALNGHSKPITADDLMLCKPLVQRLGAGRARQALTEYEKLTRKPR